MREPCMARAACSFTQTHTQTFTKPTIFVDENISLKRGRHFRMTLTCTNHSGRAVLRCRRICVHFDGAFLMGTTTSTDGNDSKRSIGTLYKLERVTGVDTYVFPWRKHANTLTICVCAVCVFVCDLFNSFHFESSVSLAGTFPCGLTTKRYAKLYSNHKVFAFQNRLQSR